MKTIKNLFRQMTANPKEVIKFDPPMQVDTKCKLQVLVDGNLFSMLLEKDHQGHLLLTEFEVGTKKPEPKEFTIRAVYEPLQDNK